VKAVSLLLDDLEASTHRYDARCMNDMLWYAIMDEYHARVVQVWLMRDAWLWFSMMDTIRCIVSWQSEATWLMHGSNSLGRWNVSESSLVVGNGMIMDWRCLLQHGFRSRGHKVFCYHGFPTLTLSLTVADV
jgi:hypothetical protein